MNRIMLSNPKSSMKDMKYYKKIIIVKNKSKDCIVNFINSINKISYFFTFKHSLQILPSEFTIILPYYKNGSIENIISIHQNESTIIEIIKSITKQIIQLNSISLYHGRLKSSNILITDSNDYIISNYCEYMLTGIKSNKFRDIYYQSPEIFRCIELINDKSDVFSIGVIFYELLNEGELPILGMDMNKNKYNSIISKLLESDFKKRISAKELLNELNYIEKDRIEENSYFFCLLLNNKYELEDSIIEKSIKYNEKNLIRITNDFNNCNFDLYAFILLKLSWKNNKWKEIIDAGIDKRKNSNAKDLYFSSKIRYGMNLNNKNRLLKIMAMNLNKLLELENLNFYRCLLLFSYTIHQQLHILKNLKCINLSNVTNDNEYIIRFTNKLHYFKHLKSLKMSNNMINSKTFVKIMKKSDVMKELETLYLTGNNLNNQSVKCFFHYSYKFPNLKYLGLCKNRKIKIKGIKLLLYLKMKRDNNFNFTIDIKSDKIFDLLYENEYIINKGSVFKSIKLYDESNDKDELYITLYILSLIKLSNHDAIKPHIPQSTIYGNMLKGLSVNEMSYPNTLISSKTNRLLTKIFERIPKLVKMDMYNSSIDDDTLYKILDCNNSSKLKHMNYMDLSFNRLGERSVNKLFNFFSTICNIAFFGLSDCNLTSNSIDGLTKNIHYLTNIRHIFIANNFSEEGTNRFFKSLTCCMKLETIAIPCSNITDKSCELLNQLLKCLPILNYLKMNRNKITDVGINNLFNGITQIISIRILDLCDNFITEKGVKLMLDNTCLTRLNDLTLSGNPINREESLYIRILALDDKYTDIEDILSDFRGESKLTVARNKVISASPNLIHELIRLYKKGNRNKDYFRIISKVIFESPYSLTRCNFLKEFDSNEDEFKMMEGIINDNSISYNYTNTISEDNLPFIVESLSYNTFLTSLSLNYVNISNDLFTKMIVKLKRIGGFKDLDIYGCKIGDSNICQLFDSFSSLTNLKTMYINYNSFTSNCVSSITNFTYLRNLQKLVMSGNYLGTNTLNVLFESLTSLQVLDTICLSNSGFTDENLELFSVLIKCLRKLVFLNLRRNSITEKGIKYLFNSFSENDTFPLKELYLCDNNLNEEGISFLLDGINKHFTNLENLFLSGNVVERVKPDIYDRIMLYDKNYVDNKKIEEISNNISDITYNQSTAIVYSTEKLLKCLIDKYNSNIIENEKYLFLLFNTINQVTEWAINTKSYIFKYLNKNRKEVEEVFNGTNEHYKLIYDNISNEGLAFLIECIKYIDDLNIFILKNTNVDDKMFISLMNEIKRLYSLREINFSNLGVGDEGMREFFKVFKNLTAVKYINISNNKFSHRIIPIFKEEAYNLIKLIRLDISYNDLKEEGCFYLLNGVEYLGSLKELLMNGIGFTDRNCEKLLDILRILHLKEIYLNDNVVTDDGVKILLPQIQNHWYLNVFEINNNKISKSINKQFECLRIE